MSRRRVYLKAFDSSGIYRSSWTEITSLIHKSGLSAIRKELEGSDFDLGVFRNSGTSIVADNSQGRFSDPGSLYTMFEFKRADSRIRVTWDLANYDFMAGVSETGEIMGEEVDLFEGLLSDEDAAMNLGDMKLKFSVLGFESLFERTLVPFEEISNGAKVSEILYVCLNQSQISSLIGVSEANISPGIDSVVDDVSTFENKTVRDILPSLLKVSNSVLYIEAGEIYVVDRTPTNDVQYQFYGQSSLDGPENIRDIRQLKSGLSRTFNFVTWKDTGLYAEHPDSIAKYGYRKKEFEAEYITSDVTRQAILDAIVAEFGMPKRELELTTQLNTEVLALPMLSRVSIDYPELVVGRSELPLYGIAQYDFATYPKTLPGFQILSTEHFKIMGTEIDVLNDTMKFTLREI